SRDLELAKMIELIPDLKKSKNKAEAIKKIKEAAKFVQVKEIRNRIQKSNKFNLNYFMNAYKIGNIIEEIEKTASNYFDMVEFDPPYAINYNKFAKSRNSLSTKNYKELNIKEFNILIDKIIKESQRILKKDSWIIIWSQHCMLKRIKDSLILHNFKSINFGFWVKPKSGVTLQPNMYLASSVEPFVYAKKGNPNIKRPGRSNAFFFNTIPGSTKEPRYHPTQKPIVLYEELLSTFLDPGEKIFVPCCGSGATLKAAFNLDMEAIGVEIEELYRDFYIESIKEGKPFKDYYDCTVKFK
ncbi:MAG: site-specific DNA-methyltransferase, partial [Promethearchaeota archaeon]